MGGSCGGVWKMDFSLVEGNVQTGRGLRVVDFFLVYSPCTHAPMLTCLRAPMCPCNHAPMQAALEEEQAHFSKMIEALKAEGEQRVAVVAGQLEGAMQEAGSHQQRVLQLEVGSDVDRCLIDA